MISFPNVLVPCARNVIVDDIVVGAVCACFVRFVVMLMMLVFVATCLSGIA